MPSCKNELNGEQSIQKEDKRRTIYVERDHFWVTIFFILTNFFQRLLFHMKKFFFEKANTFLGMLLPKHYDKIGKKFKNFFFHIKNHYLQLAFFYFDQFF